MVSPPLTFTDDPAYQFSFEIDALKTDMNIFQPLNPSTEKTADIKAWIKKDTSEINIPDNFIAELEELDAYQQEEPVDFSYLIFPDVSDDVPEPPSRKPIPEESPVLSLQEPPKKLNVKDIHLFAPYYKLSANDFSITASHLVFEIIHGDSSFYGGNHYRTVAKDAILECGNREQTCSEYKTTVYGHSEEETLHSLELFLGFKLEYYHDLHLEAKGLSLEMCALGKILPVGAIDMTVSGIYSTKLQGWDVTSSIVNVDACYYNTKNYLHHVLQGTYINATADTCYTKPTPESPYSNPEPAPYEVPVAPYEVPIPITPNINTASHDYEDPDLIPLEAAAEVNTSQAALQNLVTFSPAGENSHQVRECLRELENLEHMLKGLPVIA